jgi:hypothetical protein
MKEIKQQFSLSRQELHYYESTFECLPQLSMIAIVRPNLLELAPLNRQW